VTETRRALCPSARCEVGSILLGVILPNQRVGYSVGRFVVTDQFVAAARAGRPPEQRLRFSGTCVQEACREWTAGRCGVIDYVLPELEAEVAADGLPDCPIRQDCRWYMQSGERACRVCPLVVTDGRAGSTAAALDAPP
jgi:hypothetical protein